MITVRLERALIIAGIRYLPRDCMTPVSVYAVPVKIIIGNIMRISSAASCLSDILSKPSSAAMGDASRMPSSASTPVARNIKLKKEQEKSSASGDISPFLPRLKLL